MRLSNLFGRTLRDAPADADLTSHALLVRAAMIRPLASGLYAYLPLGWRVVQRIEAILREEMATVGAQEMRMPLVTPAELWQRSGRWTSVGAELVRLKDRADRDLVLAMTTRRPSPRSPASPFSRTAMYPPLPTTSRARCAMSRGRAAG